jgi:hypothetical protein
MKRRRNGAQNGIPIRAREAACGLVTRNFDRKLNNYLNI